MATPLWQYDPRAGRYRNLRTGRFVGPAELRELRDAFADALARESDRLAERLVNREISLAQWVTQMRTLIKDSFIAQYAAQVGGLANMTQADYGRIGAMLAGRGERGQYWYLQRFAGEIADGSLTPAQIAARARMYMGASIQAAEQGRASLLGLRLPAYPGDGTTRCLCITSPQSRVLTASGWKPLEDVKVGELVLTHRLRWRRVLAKIVKPSQPYHRQVYLRAGGGSWVGATDNHRWFTTDGWQGASDIDSSLDMVYNLRIENLFGGLDHETILRSLQCSPVQPKQANDVQGLPVSLRMRSAEGLPGAGLPVVRLARQGASAMERRRDQAGDAGRDTDGCREEAHDLRGTFPGYEVASSHRWPVLDMVLERWSQEDDLSLSLGMDQGAWSDTARLPYPSQERRQDGRPAGKPGDDAAPQTLPATWSAGSQRIPGANDGLSMRAMRAGIPQAAAQGSATSLLFDGLPGRLDEVTDAGVDLCALWAQVQEAAGSRDNAEILFGDMLPVGIALYDLTVEEDHSFVVEGLFAHNTNCRCSWRIDDGGLVWYATWVLGMAEHCPDCLTRAKTWAPLVISKRAVM